MKWIKWFCRRWWEEFTWLCHKEPIVHAHIRLWRQCHEYKTDAATGNL
jgi:hypothetical protein